MNIQQMNGMDKAFEQILEIAFDAGLLVFMTDEDNSYTQKSFN